jgi:lipopolysaccharide heptosyltransferase II
MAAFRSRETPLEPHAAASTEPLTTEAEVLVHVETPEAYQRVSALAPLTVTGWILAPKRLQQVHIACGSQVKPADHGLFRADLAEAFPKHDELSHAGFLCVLDPNPDCIGETVLTLTTICAGGTIQDLKIPVFFDLEPTPAAHPVQTERESIRKDENLRLHIEQAVVTDAGLLHISGWSFARAAMETIQIFIEDRFIGCAELKPEGKASSSHISADGFTTEFFHISDARSLPEAFFVVVKANSGGIESRSLARVERVRNFAPHPPADMHRLECEFAAFSTDGVLTLSGWVLGGIGVEQIKVFSGTEYLGEAICGRARPDVGNRFPTMPRSHRAGFFFMAKLAALPVPDSAYPFELESQLSDLTSRRFPITITAKKATTLALAGASDPIFRLDEPNIIDGGINAPGPGGLTITGWAVSRAGIDRIAVELDGASVGSAHYGTRRPDVADAYPEHQDALLSGFTFLLPRRALKAGQHRITVMAIGKSGAKNSTMFALEVDASEEEEGPWSLRHTMPAAERLFVESTLARLKTHFLVQLECDSEADLLRETLLSIKQQIYPHWQIYFSKRSLSCEKIFDTAEFADMRSKVSFSEKPDAKDSPCDWIVPVEAGDVFSTDAFYEIALAIGMNKGCDFIYADERRLSATSGEIEAFFKPDWSPHLLSSMNYIGRPWAVPRTSFKKAKRVLRDLKASSDYDFLLHYTENAAQIVHVPRVLYQRRGDGFYAPHDIKALERRTKRHKQKLTIEPGRAAGTHRLRDSEKATGLVSIIIPTCGAGDFIENCLGSLKGVSTYKNIEIIVIDNTSDQKSARKIWLREQADVVIETSEPFNWSRFNNLGVAEASGRFLLFLNDDIEVIQPDWLEAMLEEAQREEVGVVGPQLLYPDGKVQHAGVFLTSAGQARHAFRFCDADDPGYFGLALTRRDVIGVTGACMLMRREVFDAVGGFDESHAIVNNDLDFCLKAHSSGWWNIYTPFAQLVHVELASRAGIADDYDESAFKSRWASLFHKGDPFFHCHLSRAHDAYQYDLEPDGTMFSGHPYFLKRDIKKILALKVDHIGDFMTAFAAFREIKRQFPDCQLTVLAAPEARQLADLEPAIDEIIPFAFFHTRSGLGQQNLEEGALEKLEAELAPQKFDLAIDLRKHPDTRHLLRYTGAKILAGFEGDHAFPWLDIARPFEGDARFVAKRTNVADDLVSLVDQVARAGEMPRENIRRDANFERVKKKIMRRFSKEKLFARPVICVHPAAGTEFRQWPPAYFAALIDELIKTCDVNIAVIGSETDADVFAQMNSHITHRDNVVSLKGKLKLAELPYFLASCVLFVGNNSGPQHVAASVNIPTLGIHSGVVDAKEWGPLGEKAVAIQRNVACSPCYLTKLEDCHHGLACLNQLSPGTVASACKRLLYQSCI